MPTTIDIESQRMLLGTTPVRKIYQGQNLLGARIAELFANGEQGVWYDPSDISTLFQDSAGTIPVTSVEQPVGLMLDKSRSLGPNLAPSTGSLSGWTLNQTGGSVTVVDGGLFLNTTGTGTVAASFPGLLAATRYMVEFEVVSVSGLMYMEYGAGGIAKVLVPGKHRWCITGRTIFYLRNVGPAATSGSLLIKNIVVRAVPGAHAVQATTTARPLLCARYNILTDTAFTSAAEWGMGNWVFSGGEADPFGGTAAAKVQMGGGSAQAPARIIGPVAGDVVFRVWWKAGNQAIATLAARDDTTATILGTVRCDTAAVTGTVTGGIIQQQNGFNLVELRTVGFPPGNTLRIYLGGTGGVAAGTHSFWYGPDLRLVCDAGEGPTYQYVAPAAASYDTQGFPHFLRCDGVDDGMVTDSIDFTGTDKITVVAGVQKLSDVLPGIVAELTSAGTNRFTLRAPSQAGANYGFDSGGSVVVYANSSNVFPSPITNVLTGIGDISGDLATMRVNGTQATQNILDQGSGNYSNALLYLFRRGGTTVPFNGHFYGMVVVGRLLSASELNILEQFLRNKSRAY